MNIDCLECLTPSACFYGFCSQEMPDDPDTPEEITAIITGKSEESGFEFIMPEKGEEGML